MSAESTGNQIKACQLGDLEEGEIFKVELDAVGKLAIYMVDGEVFVTDDTCSHGEASLSEDGFIEGHNVICSWHDGAFDIRTGEPTALPCMVKLKTYAVTIDGDDVLIDI